MAPADNNSGVQSENKQHAKGGNPDVGPTPGAAAEANWGSAFRVAASDKWRSQSAAMGRGVTDAICQFAAPRPGMRVLDLASGTGEPAISLASAVGPTGRVVGIDVSDDLLEIARGRARQRRFDNVEFRRADAHSLPFPTEQFDLVTSRCGVMFFADIQKAFLEARRVLKPQGRVAFLVWGPFQQPYFENTIGVLLNHVAEPQYDPSQLDVFRFARPGSLSAALASAGFRNVHEETRTVPWIWPGTPEELWQFFGQVSAPFHSLIASVPQSKIRNVDDAVHSALAQFHDGERVKLTATVVLAGAEK